MAVPAAFTFATNASSPPFGVRSPGPTTGNPAAESERPPTYALPEPSTAIAKPSSLPLPPM
jgi:hypothetical protein